MGEPNTAKRTSAVSENALIVSVVAGLIVAQLTFNLLPMLIGALSQSMDLDGEQAGLVGSVDMGLLAITAMLVAPVLHRVSLRVLAVWAASASLLIQLMSIFIGEYGLLLAIRGASGIASGVLYAAASAALARSAQPDRAYAKMMVGAMIPTVLMTVSAPYAIESWGLAGAFGTMAAVAALGLPLLRFIPSEAADRAPIMLDESTDRPVLLRRSSLVLITAHFFIMISFGGLWAFTEQIGVGTGLALDEFGFTIGLSSIVGTAGAFGAAWLGTRFGRTRPLLISLVATGVLSVAMTNSSHPFEFILFIVLWSMTWTFISPYVMGAAATLDPNGRLVAAMGGAGMVGVALGPFVSGWLLQTGGLEAIGFYVLGTTVALSVLLFPLLRRLDRA